jgi:hypothetical protein
MAIHMTSFAELEHGKTVLTSIFIRCHMVVVDQHILKCNDVTLVLLDPIELIFLLWNFECTLFNEQIQVLFILSHTGDLYTIILRRKWG